MANVKIKLNSAEIRALMKSHEIASVCEFHAERLTRAAGMGYVHDVYVGRTRVNAAGKTNEGKLIDKGKTASGKRRKRQGSWVTVDGKKRFVKGYKRKKKEA